MGLNITRVFSPWLIVVLAGVLSACGANNAAAPHNKVEKPSYKLGPTLTRLDGQRDIGFTEAAKQQGLLMSRDGAGVQVAYTGSEAALREQLQGLGIAIRDSYPRYQRMDVIIAGFDDLDALQSLRAVQRIEALRKPVRR